MGEEQQGILMALGDFPEGNATATRLKYIAKTFKSGGMSVTVALLHPTLKYQVPENRAITGEHEGIRFVYLNGRTVRPQGLFAALIDTLRGIGSGLKLLLLPRAKDRANFVLFYMPSLLKHGLPILAALFRRIPIFVEACEIRSKTTSGSKRHTLGRMLNFTELWMEWLSPRIARGIIPISHRIAAFYRQKGVSDERLFMLPILTDAELYATESNAEVFSLISKRYLLNSGSFVEKDGVGYLVDAFISVVSEWPDYYLVFTGSVSKQDKKKVLDTMAKAGVQDRAIFPGMLRRTELIWAYQNAMGLLCCRTNSPYANFGFPTKVSEYLAAGAPVIATRVGDMGIYLQHKKSALLAEPENVQSIFQCMQFVIENPEAARRIGMQGRLIAQKNFHYACYAEPLAEFVRSRI